MFILTRQLINHCQFIINTPDAEHRGTVLNVSHCVRNPARMPVLPNRNEFFAL